MSLTVGANAVTRILHGTPDVNWVYHGEALIWTHADRPQIAYFDGGSRKRQLLTDGSNSPWTLRWRISTGSGARYTLKRGSVVVINDQPVPASLHTDPAGMHSGSVTENVPAATTVYTLEVTRGGYTTRAEFTFWRTVALGITNFTARGAGQVASGFAVLQRMLLSATLTGTPAADSLSLSANPRYPSNHPFGDKMRKVSNGAYREYFTAAVGGEHHSARVVAYTLTAGNAAGDTTSASVNFDWGNG